MVSMLNRETPVLLPLVWLLFRWDELPLKQLLVRFSLLLAAAFAVYGGLRAVFGHHESYSGFYYLKFNLTAFNTYLYFVLLMGPFLIFAFREWKHKPKFMRRLLLFFPFFIIFHMTIPIFQEARLMLPLFPIIIPAGICWFYRPEEKDVCAFVPNPILKKLCLPVYALFIIVFMFQIWIFLQYVEKNHVGAWRKKEVAEKYYASGHDLYLEQKYRAALSMCERGLKESPDNFDLHYLTAYIYAYHLSDPNKAYFHWSQCLKSDPENPRIEEVLKELEHSKSRR